MTRRSEGWRVAWQRGLNYTWRDAFSSVLDVDDAANDGVDDVQKHRRANF